MPADQRRRRPLKQRGVTIEDLFLGAGPVALRGALISFHSVTRLSRGELVRDSREHAPITAVLGKRELVAGLEYGIEGMRAGGTRRLRIPPHLAYRDAGVPGIPPNALLVIEVELIDVR